MKSPTNKKTDDIDLLLILNPHGWITFILYIKSKSHEFAVTQVFGNPYIDLIQALQNVINGQNSTEFYWFAEPGGIKFEINRIVNQQNKVNITISEFNESYGKEIKDYEIVVEFEIKIKQLIIIFYNQLKKTEMLLKDSEFLSNRDDFPFHEFKSFEKKNIEYLSK